MEHDFTSLYSLLDFPIAFYLNRECTMELDLLEGKRAVLFLAIFVTVVGFQFDSISAHHPNNVLEYFLPENVYKIITVTAVSHCLPFRVFADMTTRITSLLMFGSDVCEKRVKLDTGLNSAPKTAKRAQCILA